MQNKLIQYLKTLVMDSHDLAQRRVGLASTLLERAEGCAGRDPQRAEELRSAAMVYLSVVP
ncbi:MAG: hypothetical protein J0I00_16755 [Burkholderiales bacterium]|uniref:Uncharacterized protein n=1 Tax=Ottowia pentelensis TaxID=511108 RepID=A0ABV6PU35_9BURK|nr:hypothetical protein [Ottowia sp.]MBN9407058.1 hypothetical protein [Burkholderiales bacterium]MBS0402411.1 hypothetical protein [Pseudomonadota bacterium]MBS0415934.1 hypothetical protein [Pseudomonadota bacterium]HMN57338.1 hypothetical protein [Ottowia sp.]